MTDPAPPRGHAPRWLELGFDHGLSIDRPPSGSFGDPRPVGSLDLRIHSPIGIGAMVRFDVVQLAFSHAAIEVGPTARGWRWRSGPRGLTLGGGLGLAFDLRFDAPRPAPLTSVCAPNGAGGCRDSYDGRTGPFAMLQLDDHEHAFFVGLALVGRWLPHDLRSQERLGENASIAANLRVGAELEIGAGLATSIGYARAVTDWKERARATQVSVVEGLTLFLVEPGVYVQEIRGHLTADAMERSLRAAWARPDFVRPYGVVHVLAPDVTYASDLRDFPDRPAIEPAVASAVVTESSLHRMVLAAIGIASRIKRGTRVSAHSDVSSALDAVRRERASARGL